MTTLSIGILGLNRVGASLGLALKRYMKNGKYQFEIAGYDTQSAYEKSAQKAGAVDRVEKSVEATVREKHIVIMNLPYEDVKDTYRRIRRDLRDGTVILDFSSLKTPSYEWGKDYLGADHHVIGVTPIVNPRYVFDSSPSADDANEDYFDGGAFLIVPSVDSEKEAIDLAYNFAQLIGSKPRFIDPNDHDKMLAQTEQLPALLGIALFYNLMRSEGWGDMQWLTNPNFGVLTRTLKDKHPDALRDELMGNRDVLANNLDQLIETLQEFRTLLVHDEISAIEATLVSTAENYEQWLNRRNRNDWDKGIEVPTIERGGIMGMFLGDKLASRLKGKKDDK